MVRDDRHVHLGGRVRELDELAVLFRGVSLGGRRGGTRQGERRGQHKSQQFHEGPLKRRAAYS